MILVTDPSLQMSTPRRRLQTPLRGTDSPPSKKVKITNEFDELRRPLELIQILLASPLSSEELKSKFTIYLEGFYEVYFIFHFVFEYSQNIKVIVHHPKTFCHFVVPTGLGEEIQFEYFVCCLRNIQHYCIGHKKD